MLSTVVLFVLYPSIHLSIHSLHLAHKHINKSIPTPSPSAAMTKQTNHNHHGEKPCRRRHHNLNPKSHFSIPRHRPDADASSSIKKGKLIACVFLTRRDGTCIELKDAKVHHFEIMGEQFVTIKNWEGDAELSGRKVERFFASKRSKAKKSEKAGEKQDDVVGETLQDGRDKDENKEETGNTSNFNFSGRVHGGVHLGQAVQSLSTSLTGLSLAPASGDHIMEESEDGVSTDDTIRSRVQSME